MDASKARTHHIRRLVAEIGGPAEFARRTRWSQAQVSQWISESNPKGIGRNLAREIERALGLPEASMDRPSEVSMGSQAERLEPSKVAQVAKALAIFLRRRDPKAELELWKDEDAELFSAVYALFADPANEQDGMLLGGTIADLVAKREAVRHARRAGGSDADGRVAGKEAGKTLPTPEAAVAGSSTRGGQGSKSNTGRSN